MADSISVRVSRIVSGSAHAILDKVEDLAPEAMMAQAIREVDKVADEVRSELGKAEAAKHLVTTRLNTLNTEYEDLSAQIENALRAQREELAKAGVEKQINIEDQIPVLQRSLNEQQERSAELEGYILALNAKKREMQSALDEFLRIRAAQEQSVNAPGAGGRAQARIDSAGSSFERVLGRQAGVAGLVGKTTADAAKLKELQDLERNNRVAERLARIKAAIPVK
jgi:phage shock protein A